MVSSRYLLLHTEGDQVSGNLWKIKSTGPRIFSKVDMIRKNYPAPKRNFYLVIEIEPVSDPEFKNIKWNFKALHNYPGFRSSAMPFTTTLAALMRNKVD